MAKDPPATSKQGASIINFRSISNGFSDRCVTLAFGNRFSSNDFNCCNVLFDGLISLDRIPQVQPPSIIVTSEGSKSPSTSGFWLLTSNLIPTSAFHSVLQDFADDVALMVYEREDADVGERQQRIEFRAVERLGFGRSLHLDESPIRRFDDVHVDLGA